MKTVLLLLFTLTPIVASQAFTQGPGHIIPFEDYRNCYTGFKTYSGDTIYQAKFEDVYSVSSSNIEHSKYCWIVEEMGRSGVLNPYGEYVLPSQYDTIFYIGIRSRDFFKDDWLITVSNGKYGIVDFEGNEVLAPIYQHIEPHEHWMKVRNSEGKVGLLDSLLRVEVPLEYEDIFPRNFRDLSKDTLVNYSYFGAEKDGHLGMLKPNLSPILPYEFETFRITGVWEDFILNTPYIIATKNGKQGLHSYDGNLIIPHEFESIELTYNRRQLDKNVVQTALASSDKRYTFFNLATGARSKPFYEMRVFGGKAIAKNNRGKWSVIDSNGSIIGTGSKDWYAEEESLDSRDSIVVVTSHSKRNQEQYKRLLYHYGNGKFVPEYCQWLLRTEIDGELYYWSKSNENIIIYDSHLRKVKSLEQHFDDILEDLEDHGILLNAPINVLKNNNGLIGGFDARGTMVIPQKYTEARIILKQESHRYMNYLRVPDYFEFTNDSSIAYYSLNGDLIRELNFNSIYNLSSQYLAATNLYYTSILDLDYNLILDRCTKVFQYHTLHTNWKTQFSSNTLNNTYCLYAIRDQTYLVEVDGHFVPMDSSRYNFKNKLQFQFDVLIDRSGSIVSPEDSKIKLVGSHYIVENEDSFLILSLNGDVELSLDGISEIQHLDRNLLHITFQDGLEGIYNLVHAKWEINPEVQKIKRITGNQRLAKYCILRRKISPHWQFYSAKGNKVSDLNLDHPLPYMGSMNLVIIKGKLGILTDDLKIVLPAEYDYITKIRESWFLRKNNQWHISSYPFTAISEGYDYISTQAYPEGNLVFRNGQIGALNKSIKEIVPLSTEQELCENYDLATLLNPTDHSQIDQFPIVSEENKALSKSINNRIILEGSRFLTTKNDVMPLALQHNVDTKSLKSLNNKERRKYETPSFFSKSYYSCIINSTERNWNIHYRDRKETTNYYNYTWNEGVLEQIDLTDLFQTSSYEAHLDSLIIDYLNKYQLYGISCVNLNELLITAKENFILKPKGIEFLAMNRNSKTLVIPYSELLKFMKHPEEFIEP